LAYETAQQLSRLGKPIKGVILIDSPFPQDHHPLPGPVIEYVLRQLKPSVKPALTSQFQAHAQFLSQYNAKRYTNSTKFVILQSQDPFDTTRLCGVSYPWLENNATHTKSTSQWETLIGRKPLVLPIPGNHFEPFLPEHVSEVLLSPYNIC
jgi:thioesterase domain-containing protein